MLRPEQVKPFISHPDILVSNAAVRYFSESFIYDAELLPLVLEKLRQVKKDETFYLHYSYNFPKTTETVAEIFELLHSNTIDSNTKYHLTQILIRSEADFLEPMVADLSQFSNPLSELAKERIQIARLSNEDLLESFEQFLKESYGLDYSNPRHQYGRVVVHELAKRNIVNPDRVMEAFDSYDPDDYDSFETIYFTQLAGEMRLEKAIPLICSFLSGEDDLLLEHSVSALVRIGTASVIDELTQRYEREREGYFRLFASGVFGKIKLQASEDALLKLLPFHQDLTYATILADGLCELGSSKGIPVVLEMVENGYDEGYLDLRESLYVNCIMNDVDLPDLQLWRQEIAEEEQNRIKRVERLNRLASERFAGKQLSQSPLKSSKPRVNPNKVGRNDPCPCGSGKKYKKCCGG
jgi:hypothetical protein